MVPIEPSLSSVTTTPVNGTSPVLVTAKLYVTTSPACAEAGPDLTIWMAGLRISTRCDAVASTVRPKSSMPDTLAEFGNGSGVARTVCVHVHCHDSPAERYPSPLSPVAPDNGVVHPAGTRSTR